MREPITQKQRTKRNQSQASLENLKPFAKGQSGNPGGLPKGTPKVSVAYMKLLALSPEELAAFEPKTTAESIAYARIMESLSGDAISPMLALNSTREICDRTEGKALQRVEHKNIDFAALTDDELRAIARGEGISTLRAETPESGFVN